MLSFAFELCVGEVYVGGGKVGGDVGCGGLFADDKNLGTRR